MNTNRLRCCKPDVASIIVNKHGGESIGLFNRQQLTFIRTHIVPITCHYNVTFTMKIMIKATFLARCTTCQKNYVKKKICRTKKN